MTSVLNQKPLLYQQPSNEAARLIRQARERLSSGSFFTLDELKEKLGLKS